MMKLSALNAYNKIKRTI